MPNAHSGLRWKDRGTIEALNALDDDELAEIAKCHNNDSNALRTTIAGSGGTNFLLVPGAKGTVKFLHHGFATTTHLGGPMILCFIQGNFSSSPFKVIPLPGEAVRPIDQGRPTTRGKDTGPTACPDLDKMLGATDQDDFAALTGDQEDTNADRPNHLFIHPRLFTQQFALVDSSYFRTPGTIAADLLYVCQSIRSGLGSIPSEE